MRVLLINPPYQTITSNVGVGHQVPLGLLMVGGPLIDAGHEVKLLDAEARRLSIRAVVRQVREFAPDVVMTGHAGSTPAHPMCVRMLRAIKEKCPAAVTVYGGVYPTYHAREIFENEPGVDVIVRGEGEPSALEIVENVPDLSNISGITFRRTDERIIHNPDRPPARNLDAMRVAWELIDDWDLYTCFGLGRSAIVQLSRGCPHRCTYCGQHGFWVKWRYRDPVKLADEIEWLYRAHDVRFITLADENPTTRVDVWRRFLEELARRRLPVKLFATIRATDIVRDAELLPLYRDAGMLYVLMGIESTRDDVLADVRKGSSTRDDFRACQLLKQHGIFSILGHIVGLRDDETWGSFGESLRNLMRYDGDYLNAMYVTPHDWTPMGRDALATQRVVEPDLSKWDYRHQVLAQRHMQPWQVLLAVKWMELRFHLRPSRLRAMLFTRVRETRKQLWWTARHTGMVWLAELVAFFVPRKSQVGILWKRSSARINLPVVASRRDDSLEASDSRLAQSVCP